MPILVMGRNCMLDISPLLSRVAWSGPRTTGIRVHLGGWNSCDEVSAWVNL